MSSLSKCFLSSPLESHKRAACSIKSIKERETRSSGDSGGDWIIGDLREEEESGASEGCGGWRRCYSVVVSEEKNRREGDDRDGEEKSRVEERKGTYCRYCACKVDDTVIWPCERPIAHRR